MLPAALWTLNSCSESAEAGFNDAQINQTPGNSTGEGGSLNQLTVAGPNLDYLYAVRGNEITVFDISNVNTPAKLNTVYAHEEIETVHNMGENLYLGTPVGMLVYSIEEPASPQFIGEFRHVRSCDPVVADGNFAYVTLRGGGQCGGSTNELHVLDITNPSNPIMVNQYQMTGPYGLGIEDGTLFVCDGDDGLKVFDASNPAQGLKQVAHFGKIKAIDVIASDGLLVLIAEDGLYQYKYNGPESIELISSMSIGE